MEGLRVAVVGVGRAGGALGRALFAAGLPIAAVWSRTTARAQELADETGAQVCSSPAEAAASATLVLLAVTDALIAPFAAALAAEAHPLPDAVIVHLSGASGADVLAPLAASGWRTAAFHPLQTFADSRSPLLPGSLCAIEGDPSTFQLLAGVAERLGATVLALAAADRPLYHAAATITANYTVTLVSQAAALLARCGLDQQQSLAALLPLLRGAVENLQRVGLPDALTGPIVRGDVLTIQRHLTALAERAPELLPSYRALGAATLPLARVRGTDQHELAQIAEVIVQYTQ
ncbi:MAG: DUF2520 domain-containing protein [Roseiflexaceae bacterium]|nr:DUF2520 domain-containing protein [Roseiflexaceae bacterium]